VYFVRHVCSFQTEELAARLRGERFGSFGCATASAPVKPGEMPWKKGPHEAALPARDNQARLAQPPLPSLPLIAAGLGWDIVDPACACPAARMLGGRLWRIRSAWSGSASGDWRILCARAEDSPARVAH
jgi:hypothetical protein